MLKSLWTIYFYCIFPDFNKKANRMKNISHFSKCWILFLLEAIHKWHQIVICRGVCEICLTAPGSLKYVPNDAELSGNNFHKTDFFDKKSHFIIAPILKIHSNSVQEICFVWLCKQTNWRVTMDFQNRAIIKWLF